MGVLPAQNILRARLEGYGADPNKKVVAILFVFPGLVHGNNSPVPAILLLRSEEAHHPIHESKIDECDTDNSDHSCAARRHRHISDSVAGIHHSQVLLLARQSDPLEASKLHNPLPLLPAHVHHILHCGGLHAL